MSWVSKIILNGFALLVADKLISGFSLEGIITALIAAFILGLMNTIVRPIIIFFTLPITVLTLGLFILIINAVTFTLTAWLIEGFTIYNISGAFFGALFTGIISWILNSLAKN